MFRCEPGGGFCRKCMAGAWSSGRMPLMRRNGGTSENKREEAHRQQTILHAKEKINHQEPHFAKSTQLLVDGRKDEEDATTLFGGRFSHLQGVV